ncbi:hypothetical protein EDB82DRAFT_421100 [Fusarium venenatum]|uniref:uncharacterized protein n=1 Tax=Fusarium venenatum TaxID=56646 RepID=UPI001D31D488|nr:hypothetical protein EDB82DRAFT_421100 [Fusarium venenatum]
MASAQEAEEIIQSLSGHSTLLGKHVEKCAKRLLFELLRYTNGKTFTTAKAEEDSPFVTFKVYPDRIVSDCNSDNLTKEDLQAICRATNKANFKTIVAATKRTCIQSGNFSFEFQHNPADHDNGDMRPVWVTSVDTVPENVTRITLNLHDQGNKKEIQKLREVIASQFESLQKESILFLDDMEFMKIEYFDNDGKIRQSRHFQKEIMDEHRVSVKVTTVDSNEKHMDAQLYHVAELDYNDETKLILAFPLTDDKRAKKLFNLIPLGTSPLGFHIHADVDIEDDIYSTTTKPFDNLGLQEDVSSVFLEAILQFCEHPTLRYHWPLFLRPGATEQAPFWPDLDTEIRNWISRNPVFISRHVKHWRLISHLAAPGPDAQDDSGNPLLDDKINDPFLSSNYPPGVAATKPVYFPTTKGIDIALGLPGRVMNESLKHGVYSKALYEQLGVVEVPVTRMREVIFAKLSSSKSPSLDDIKSYLGYLYLTHQPFSSESEQQYRAVRVLTLDMKSKNPWESIIYLPGMEHPYTPQSLLGAGMFLGLIQHLWDFEKPQIAENKALVSEIQGLPAKGLCGLDRSVALRNTCVPLQELKDIVARYMEYPDKFPFLKLQGDKYEGLCITTKWSFLTKHFGVRQKNDLDFLLQILDSIKHSCKKLSSPQMKKVFELYSAIKTRFQICPTDEKQRALKGFEDSGILYVDSKGEIWTDTSRCLWNAPSDMISRYSLKKFYEERVLDKKTMQDLSHLFCVILRIRDASMENLVEELCFLRDNGCNDVARVENIYNYLHKEIKVSPEIRTAFGDKRVILVQDDDGSMWLSVKECFWSEAEVTPMQCSLKTWYPGLKQFFVNKLGVKISAYDKLVYSTPTDVKQVKKIMLSFMDEAGFFHEFEEEPLGTAKIFPVRRPTAKGQPPSPVELCSLDTDFCIGDRDYLRKSLQSSIKMLSFDVTEVRRLQPLFRWLSIEDRCLSIRVVETMNVVPSCILKEWDLSDKAYHIARKQLCFFSVLPRKLQQWLTQDESHVYMDASFEITNALTLIFASDAANMDEILEDQGISQVSFENQDIIESKLNGEAHQPLAKEDKPSRWTTLKSISPRSTSWHQTSRTKSTTQTTSCGNADRQPSLPSRTRFNDICAGCSAKRTVGALAMAREARVIGELISHDVYGNEIWRYKVEE